MRLVKSNSSSVMTPRYVASLGAVTEDPKLTLVLCRMEGLTGKIRASGLERLS